MADGRWQANLHQRIEQLPKNDCMANENQKGHDRELKLNGFTASVVWLAGSTLCYVLLFQTLNTSFWGGEFFPTGMDSFYHARRILDAYYGIAANFDLDAHLNFPDGMWVPWPWLYDTMMAGLVNFATSLSGNQNPQYVLFSLPPLWVYINFGLLVYILFLFRLDIKIAVSTALAFCFLPFLFKLHGFGRVDHHFAELTMLFLAIVTSLKWLRNINNLNLSLCCGAVFALAPAIHNGLFLLYVPLLVTMFMAWRANRLSIGFTAALTFFFCSNLLLLVLLFFSGPFKAGFFTYYFFSWFHLYIAVFSSIIIIFFSKLPCSGRHTLYLIALTVFLSLPLMGNFIHGYEWVGADIPYLSTIVEMQPLFNFDKPMLPQVTLMISNFGIFAVLGPPALACAIWYLAKNSDDSLVFISAMLLLSVLLFWHQRRFVYLAIPVLVLFSAIAADYWIKRAINRNTTRKIITYVASMLFLSTPILTFAVLTSVRPALGVPEYPLTLPLVKKAGELCAEDPGVVLADSHFGNMVRYLTNCSVISNMMFITQNNYKKAAEVQHLLQQQPQDIVEHHRHIKYILVTNTRFDTSNASEKQRYPLTAALLGPEKHNDLTNIERILEIKTNRAGQEDVYGGLFKIAR